MKLGARTTEVLLYAAALGIGVAVMAWVLPLGILVGTGPGWATPGSDQAQSLAGHLAFQADRWRWPLLLTQRLFWPQGISLALVDANALVSLGAKVWVRAVGGPPINALGAFVGACFVLQPVAAVYAARGLRVGPWAALAAGVIAACWPAMMFRMMHINLCAHFLVLVALGMTLRRIERPRSWLPPLGLMLVSILIHPYFFQLVSAVLAAAPLHAALRGKDGRRRDGWQRELGLYLLWGVASVGLLTLLAGPLGGGDKGFAFFSMNLGSPVWPQASGVFGAGLPILDGTGGQYEGFNWLGAGTWLLLLATVAAAVGRRQWPRPPVALVVVLAGLALLSLGSRVYAGQWLLLDLGVKPWEDIFGSFRSAGRAFWPVGYALLLAGVAGVDRLTRQAGATRALGAALLAGAVVLQVIDIGPMRDRAHTGWANGSGIAVPAVPDGTTLFTVAPHPGCAPDAPTKLGGPLMLLDAVRKGAQTGDIGLGRSPSWFSCEAIVADALELPMFQHEVRAFSGAPIQAALHPLLMGPRSVCRRTPLVPGAQITMDPPVIFCGNDVAEFAGDPVPPAPMPAPIALPFEAGPEALTPLLGFGWQPGLVGGAWSEGPRSTILLPVPTGRGLELRLRASGIGIVAGQGRVVRVTAGRIPVGQFTLPDGLMTEVTVAIPPSTIVTGVLRVALDVLRPVDPVRRGMTAPVKRAAIRLSGVTLRYE